LLTTGLLTLYYFPMKLVNISWLLSVPPLLVQRWLWWVWVWLFHDYVYDYGKCRWLGAQYTIIAKWRQLGGASITSACHPVTPPAPQPPPITHQSTSRSTSTQCTSDPAKHRRERNHTHLSGRNRRTPAGERPRRRLIAVHAKNIVNHSLTVCYLLNKANDLMA